MSNVHVSPDVLSTLPLLQNSYLYKLQQKNMHATCFNKVAGLQICIFIKKRLQYRCFLVILQNF